MACAQFRTDLVCLVSSGSSSPSSLLRLRRLEPVHVLGEAELPLAALGRRRRRRRRRLPLLPLAAAVRSPLLLVRVRRSAAAAAAAAAAPLLPVLLLLRRVPVALQLGLRRRREATVLVRAVVVGVSYPAVRGNICVVICQDPKLSSPYNISNLANLTLVSHITIEAQVQLCKSVI